MNKSVNEILVENGLDFTIEKLPLSGMVGKTVIESPYFGLYNSKSGEIIHSVKKGYTPSQNKDIVAMVLKGMAPFGDDLVINKAGALAGGKKVFLQLGISGQS